MSHRQVPAPRFPTVEAITSVEQLLPVARLITRREHHPWLEGLELKPGTKVLMIIDSTNDRLVIEAFRRAIREAGGVLEIIELQGYPELTDPVDLVDTMFSRQWWPGWSWSAVKEADIIMQGAMLKLAHTPDLPLDIHRKPKPRVVDMEWTADILASNYETFPVEVRDAIDRGAWQDLAYAEQIEVFDAEGTALKWSLTREDWQRPLRRGQPGDEDRPNFPGHLLVPLPALSLEGVLVASSLTFGGPVPRTVCTLKGGQVTEVEGGGKFGEALRDSIERYKDLRFPGFPGPGAGWLSTLGIGTHPKARPSPHWEKLSGSARMHAWAFGHRRSGILHISIGGGVVKEGYKVIRHVNLCFSTLLADGRKIIDQGHLMALEDPEVKAIAQRYGDPEELLAEEWVPAVPGVNVP